MPQWPKNCGMACEKGSVVQASSVVVFGGKVLYRRRTKCCPFFSCRFGGILPLVKGKMLPNFLP